jgi:hypothetical protein
MSKIVKYKTTYIKRGELIVKGPCKYEDDFGGLPLNQVMLKQSMK